MQWLMHGAPSAVIAESLRRHGHVVHDMSEAGVKPEADAGEILRVADKRQWDIITRDEKLVSALFQVEHRLNQCVVYLQFDGDDVEQADAIDRLFARYPRLSPRRLYTITKSRVKIRQLKR